MAVTLRSCVVHMFGRLKVNNGALSPTVLTRQQCSHSVSLPSSSRAVPQTSLSSPPTVLTRQQSSHSVSLPSSRVVPQTSLSSPPWSTDLHHIDLEEQLQGHAAVVRKVNDLLCGQNYGRLFAVVQFSGRQWKVTGEDLILVESRLEAQCGDRICMEKVLMVGGEDFSLIGRPLLGCDLVRVEATVVEKTESWPKVVQRFKKRKRFETRRWMVQPQTVLRINSIQVAPALS